MEAIEFILEIVKTHPMLAVFGSFFTWGCVTVYKKRGEEKITSGSGYSSLAEETQTTNYIGHKVNIDQEELVNVERTETAEGVETIVETETEDTYTVFSIFRKK